MNAIDTFVDNLIPSAEMDKMNNLVCDFNDSYRKCALNYLEMGRIALEAKTMGKVMYALFCERVWMKGDSEMSKLIALGKNYEQMKRHLECLPSKWTTLYNLTRLKEEQFNSLCKSGVIHPKLTGAESLTLIGKNKSKTVTEKEPIPVVADNSKYEFTGIGVYISCDSPEKAEAIKTLVQLALKDGLSVRRSSEYELYDEAANDASVLEVA